MAKIYLVRHAESVANTQGVYQGQTHDSDLSPLGHRQAQALARRFAGGHIDTILTSPLCRTRQTAAALGSVIDEPALLETNHGLWEGLSKSDIAARWPELYALWLTRPSLVEFPGGEKFVDTADRAQTWLNSILGKTAR